MSARTGGAAFPRSGSDWMDTSGRVCNDSQRGMTLRDYLAAKAMAALIGTAVAPCLGGLEGFEPHTAQAAYRMADAMLAAREVTA